MNKLKPLLASVLILMSALNCFAQNSGQRASRSIAQTELEKQIAQACREAVLELKFAREKEALLQKQVEELKALNATQAEQVAHYRDAVTKYEAAIAARTQAEALVSQLRENYDKQIAQAEKALAVANTKISLWKVLAAVGVVVGFVLGQK